MRRVVDSEGNGDEEINFDKAFDLRADADPVVYHLVRVEGDGRLVPATNDEVIEVDHLLDSEKVEIPLERCVRIEILSYKNDVEYPEGLSLSKITDDHPRTLNARIEYIAGVLQQVKQEEHLRLSCESLHLSSKSMDVEDPSSDHLYRLHSCNDDVQLGSTSQENAHSTGISGSHIAQLETCLKPAIDPVTSGSSVFDPCTSLKPDFSFTNGEICLDNLTVRELQEVFRVTFGRQTNVKDKRWLKRQLTLRLTNSLENQATNVVTKENLSYSGVSSEFKVGSLHTNQVTCQDSATVITSKIEVQRVSSSKRLRKPFLRCDTNSENLLMEQSVTKRVRTPNRRYIADLLEVETGECAGKFSSLRSCPTSRFRSVRNIVSQGTMHLIRHDSLGGCGIQIPYAYRVRRGRPRRNFVAFVNHHPSDMAAKLVKTFGVRVSEQGGDSGSLMWKAKATQLQIRQRNTGSGMNHEKRSVEEPDLEGEHDNGLEYERTFLYRDNSDDGADILSSMRSGAKRNHHRVWTLSEVVKLVEGVARYGLGRWSEIKRLVFASYTYRTSVDLKDKWRNLLRVCFAQRLGDKQSKNTRKHASIPEPILLRVRELAEMNAHVDDKFSRNKLVGTHRISVQEK